MKLDAVSSPALGPAHAAPAPSADAQAAGKQFEAMLLRVVLKSLEKTTHVGKQSSASGGVYGAMIVDTLSDVVAASGGTGLGELVARSLTPEASPRPLNSAAGLPLGPSGEKK